MSDYDVYDDDEYDDDEKLCEQCEFPQSSCECEHFGRSLTPPWVKRGIDILPEGNNGDWESVWPEIDNTNIDPVNAAADFYMLESLASGALHTIPGLQVKGIKYTTDEAADKKFFYEFGIKKNQQAAFIEARNAHIQEQRDADPVYELQWIMGEADDLLNTLVEKLDATLVPYSHMAISGELRHHNAFRVPGGREVAWCAWKPIFETVGNDALQDAAKLFYEFPDSGYGGAPWANCAETLWGRLEGKLGPDGPDGPINKRMFIDRFWTLEHNGGCFLNKISWSMEHSSQSIGFMRNLLDAHGADPTDIETLITYASKSTVDLYARYVKAMNIIGQQRGADPIEDIASDLFDEITVCCGCSSHPEYGHFDGCAVMERKSMYNFGWEFVDGEEVPANSWIRKYTKKQMKAGIRRLYEASMSEDTALSFDKYGKLTIFGDEVYNINFTWSGTDDTDEWMNGQNQVFSGTFNEMIALPGFELKELVPQLEELEEFSYNLIVTNAESWKEIANHGDYAYGKSAIDEATFFPLQPKTFINKQLGGYKIV